MEPCTINFEDSSYLERLKLRESVESDEAESINRVGDYMALECFRGGPRYPRRGRRLYFYADIGRRKRDRRLEIYIDHDSRLVNGISVSNHSRLDNWPDFEVEKHIRRTPALVSYPDDYSPVPIAADFSLATKGDSILAWWRDLDGCDAYHVDRCRFLFKDGIYVGFLATGFSEVEIEKFKAFAVD